MNSSKKQFSNVLEMQKKIKELTSINDELERKLGQVLAKNAALDQEIKDALKILQGDVALPWNGLVEIVTKVNERYSREYHNMEGEVKALTEENKKLWYFIGVALKDPNIDKPQIRIGRAPNYNIKKEDNNF